jgi:hypothetical protein
MKEKIMRAMKKEVKAKKDEEGNRGQQRRR